MKDETIKDGFVFFWYGILSQWHPTSITESGITYKTAEHWMMYHKARLFGDGLMAQDILKAKTPRDAKKLGRKVQGFNRELWDQECFGIVVEGNRLKFSQNKEAREFLLGTGNLILVEASPVDDIWGIKLGQEDPRATNPALWPGKNLLGQALMVVRSKL